MITYKGLPAPIICDYLSREASRKSYAEGVEFQIGRIEMVANTGTYSDNSTQDVTSSASWQSDDSTIVAISSSGVLSAKKSGGPVKVSASSGVHSGSLPFMVTGATLSSILVSPSPVPVFVGQTSSLKATGVFSDGTSQDVTGQVSWSTVDGSIASVSALGVLTGQIAGQTTVTAASGAISGNATVNVSAVVLQSILVTPSNASIAIGQTQPFAAFGIFSDGSTTEITKSIVWDTDAHAVATMGQDGVATGAGAGTANVIATSGAVIGTVQLTVTPAVLKSINIFPDDPSVPAGGQLQFTVTGTFSDSTTQQLTNATYSSTDASIAAIDPVSGVATGVAADPNPITITATVGGFTDSTTLTETAATLQSIAVAPESATIVAGTTQAFSVSGIYSDGSIQPLLEGVNWTSSAPGIAAVDSNGLATAIAAGQASMQAEFAGFSASADLTVTAPTLVSITVTPSQPTVGIGGSQQFTATGVFSDGSQQDLTPEASGQTFQVSGYRRSIDIAGGRSRTEQTRTPNFAYFQGQAPQKQVLGIDGNVGYNVAANGTAARVSNAVAKDRRAEIFHHPLTIVRAALDPAARLTNPRTAGGERVIDVAVPNGSAFTLAIDAATTLPTRVVSMTDNPNLGDVAIETSFAGYQDVAGLKLPARLTTKTDKYTTATLHVTKQTVDGDIKRTVGTAEIIGAIVRNRLATQDAPQRPRPRREWTPLGIARLEAFPALVRREDRQFE
jgi:uncharacterized protein YjdB